LYIECIKYRDKLDIQFISIFWKKSYLYPRDKLCRDKSDLGENLIIISYKKIFILNRKSLRFQKLFSKNFITNEKFKLEKYFFYFWIFNNMLIRKRVVKLSLKRISDRIETNWTWSKPTQSNWLDFVTANRTRIFRLNRTDPINKIYHLHHLKEPNFLQKKTQKYQKVWVRFEILQTIVSLY